MYPATKDVYTQNQHFEEYSTNYLKHDKQIDEVVNLLGNVLDNLKNKKDIDEFRSSPYYKNIEDTLESVFGKNYMNLKSVNNYHINNLQTRNKLVESNSEINVNLPA